MMRSLRSVAAALGVVGSLALPSAALAAGPQTLTCSGVVSGGTYSSLTVPSGQFCYLSNATILGNATVQSTGSLELDQNGTINGNDPAPYTDLGTGLENRVDGRSLGQCATPNAPQPGAVASARSALRAAGVPAP